MSEDVNTPSTDGVTSEATSPTPIPPTDFREYVKWRETGALPSKEEAQPAAAEPDSSESAPQARSDPQSGADDQQQPEEEESREAETRPMGERGQQRQRKIDRLTRELELAKAQLAVLQPPAAKEPPKPAEPPGKPKLENFTTLEEYQEALTDWKLDQREAAKAVQSAEAQQQSAWATSEKAARAAHADYDDVVSGVKAPEGPGVAAARQAMLRNEAGAVMLYYLATHPDDLSRIAAMQPLDAAVAIGELAAKVRTPPVAATTKPAVSAALPKPPPSLTHPAKTATHDINNETFARNDYKAWAKLREAQLRDR